MTLELKARTFATAAHAAVGQLRKYTNQPYIVHPQAVADLVRNVPHTDEMLAAAWLHDVVEDTRITLDLIDLEFGQTVGGYVAMLTNTPRSYGNREARKNADLARLALAPAPVQTVKLADLIDNTATIVRHDPEFAAVYMREKRALVEAMDRGDQKLRAQAFAQMTVYFSNQGAV